MPLEVDPKFPKDQKQDEDSKQRSPRASVERLARIRDLYNRTPNLRASSHAISVILATLYNARTNRETLRR